MTVFGEKLSVEPFRDDSRQSLYTLAPAAVKHQVVDAGWQQEHSRQKQWKTDGFLCYV